QKERRAGLVHPRQERGTRGRQEVQPGLPSGGGGVVPQKVLTWRSREGGAMTAGRSLLRYWERRTSCVAFPRSTGSRGCTLETALRLPRPVILESARRFDYTTVLCTGLRLPLRDASAAGPDSNSRVRPPKCGCFASSCRLSC